MTININTEKNIVSIISPKNVNAEIPNETFYKVDISTLPEADKAKVEEAITIILANKTEVVIN